MHITPPKLVASRKGIAIVLIATSCFGDVVVAQTSIGSPDPQSQVIPGPPPAPAFRSDPPPLNVPPNYPSPPPSTQQTPSADILWGAIGFTADGSYSTTWKMASRPEAEARVATKCAEYGRGSCKVVTFSGKDCVALATFIGSYRRRRWALSFTAGGSSYPEAQNAAIASCNADERSQMRCQPRTAACADGR